MVYRTTPKMEKRKAAKRSKFLNIATRLFGRHGYHKTTVPMIVEKSDTSTGSFYFYFRDKEDVFAAVLERIGEQLAAELNQAIQATPGPLEQMRAAVKGLFLFLAENPEEARILVVESSGLSPRLEQVRRTIVGSHTRSVEKALSQLPAPVDRADPKVLARCWVGAVYEAARYWLEEAPNHRRNAEEVAAEVAAFNLRGIGSQP